MMNGSDKNREYNILKALIFIDTDEIGFNYKFKSSSNNDLGRHRKLALESIKAFPSKTTRLLL